MNETVKVIGNENPPTRKGLNKGFCIPKYIIRTWFRNNMSTGWKKTTKRNFILVQMTSDLSISLSLFLAFVHLNFVQSDSEKYEVRNKQMFLNNVPKIEIQNQRVSEWMRENEKRLISWNKWKWEEKKT
mgnify:CR=1 FL=1